MASKAFYMPFFTKDYLSSSTVLKMSMAAQGIYLRLLFINWEEGYLDGTDDELPQLSGATIEEWQQFEKHLDRCFPRDGDYRSNRRVTFDRNESIKSIEAKSRAGKEGADKRWHGYSGPNGTPIADPLGEQCEGNADPMLSNLSQSNPTYSSLPPPAEEKPPSKRFTAPSIEEVIAYGKEIGLPESECKSFWFYYDSKDWKRGKERIQKWKSALSGWKTRWEGDKRTAFSDQPKIYNKAELAALRAQREQNEF